MPPRPSNPAIRYRPAITVPGRNRPSSTMLVALMCGTVADAGADPTLAPSTIVSADVASSGAEQAAQYRLLSAHSFVQAGHRTIRVAHILSRAKRGARICHQVRTLRGRAGLEALDANFICELARLRDVVRI